MMKNNIILSLALFVLGSSNTYAACSAAQQAPAGKPDNFDINKHLAQFDKAGNAASQLVLGGLTARASIMASMFAPHRKYDLKNNPNMKSSQEFGNWFYGAAAAQMGFSEQEALLAGAVVQQWQNYDNQNHPDAGELGKLASNIVHAINTGQGDNHDDAAPISGGHSYSEDVYDTDSNRGTNADSCSPGGSGTSSSWGSSTGGWSGGAWLGGGCYGNCSGSGSATIKDLPPIIQE